MALRRVKIDERTLQAGGGNVARVARAFGYAQIIESAAHLDNLPNVRVTPATLGTFVRHHPESAAVERAIRAQRSYPVAFADVGDVDALMRHARPELTDKTLLSVEPLDLTADADATVVVLATPLPTRAERY